MNTTDVIEKIIKGTIDLMYYGVSRLDRTNTKKYIISIESPQLSDLKEEKEIIENYKTTPFKPKWFTEDSKKINLKTLYEIPVLYNGKSLVEDGQFAVEVLEHINKRVNQFKEEDGNLYAIYGTPAENLCGLQVKQFREKYGIIEGVSDRDYVSNSFHCHVAEDITPIQKQDLEYRFWELCNGGKIQYVKYPIDYNIGAIKTLIRRAMDFGFYEGVNMSSSLN